MPGSLPQIYNSGEVSRDNARIQIYQVIITDEFKTCFFVSKNQKRALGFIEFFSIACFDTFSIPKITLRIFQLLPNLNFCFMIVCSL